MENDMLKKQIRLYLLSVRPYLNLSGIARQFGISRQAISFFMKDDYHLNVISLDKLVQIQNFIHDL